MRSITFGFMLAAAALVAQADTPRTPSPAGAEVYFESPADGASIKGPVTVRFGLKGMGVAPAGIKFDNSGHHHLLIDTDPPADLGKPLPATDHVVHFGKGQTETTITLPPGKHTLQLVLGDALHIPHDPPVVSKKITITVKP
ncbi:MAG: DUF4399 domain-containing protein [Steroidobacteraceae bacterium]